MKMNHLHTQLNHEVSQNRLYGIFHILHIRMDRNYPGLLHNLAVFNGLNGLIVPNLDSYSLVQLISELNADFKSCVKDATIKKVTCTLISHDKCFFSNVFEIIVECIHNNQDLSYEFVLKLPLVDSLGKENRQSMINFHNVECGFYERFKNPLFPRVFASVKFEPDGENFGLILMESFVRRAEALDLYGEIRDAQIINAARAIANVQFYARDPKCKKWWTKQIKFISLDDLYSDFIPKYFPIMAKRAGFAHLISSLKPLLNRQFGLYALRELPSKYDAITMCHGDFQSQNLMFEKVNGTIGDKLIAIIDFQLVFMGSSLFDLGKFLAMACNESTRIRMYLTAFKAYFYELGRLYNSANLTLSFTKEQAFELYELVFCHTSTVMVELIPYLEEKYGNLSGWAQKIRILEKRALKLVEFVIPLIEKYDLSRFDEIDCN